MPLIALTGPLCAGKHTVAEWLVRDKGFRRIALTESDQDANPDIAHSFSTIDSLVEYATLNWRENLVIVEIERKAEYDALSKRPFFLLLGVDAPITARWTRYRVQCSRIGQAEPDLEEFVRKCDAHFYNWKHEDLRSGIEGSLGLAQIFSKASLRIMNTGFTVERFWRDLEELDIVNHDRIRPSWDAYFMQLASLASLRSNCMKRRVGCVLVRNKRVISTGYNGTPRGLTNCNEGGCARCNSGSAGGIGLGTCLCLHAEENALLESGRERVGDEAILYCNTCPCLTCSVKIAQVGVKEVVYNQAYSMDDRSASVLEQAGVLLRQFSPPYED